jgi:hypothetical protein
MVSMIVNPAIPAMGDWLYGSALLWLYLLPLVYAGGKPESDHDQLRPTAPESA